MRILALDLGTQTGVASGCAGEGPALSTWELPAGGGEDVGPFMRDFIGLFEAALEGVELVIFEAPFIAIRTGRSGPYIQRDQVARAYGMTGFIEGLCARRLIPVYSVVTVTVKKAFAGTGRADKADMMRAARRRGFAPANDHEADAAACWLYAVQAKCPEHAHRFDEIFAAGAA